MSELLSTTSQQWEVRLGENIRQVRLRRDMTQAEVARQANIDRTTVGRIENGEGGSISSLVQIARVLEREDWLGSFSPAVSAISPMERLRAQRRGGDTQRRRASKRSNSS